MRAAGDHIAVSGLVSGKAEEKPGVLAELVHGRISGLIFLPKHLCDRARCLPIEFDDVHEIAVGEIHDAAPDDEGRRWGGAAQFGANALEVPDFVSIAHAESLQLPVCADDQTTLAEDGREGRCLSFTHE